MAGVCSKIEELLKCMICHDMVRDPKTLQCFHSFCEPCLGQLDRVTHAGSVGIHCPVCRAFSMEGVAKRNFLVHELLETHKGYKSGQHNLCGMCLKQKPELKCEDCKTFMCSSCKILHMRLPICRGHHIIEVDNGETGFTVDRIVFCEKHTDQPIIFNCQDCEVPLCIKCKVTKHETHKTETVEDTLERVLPEMDEYAEKIELLMGDIDGNSEELTVREGEVKAAFEKCRKVGEKKLKDLIGTATDDYNALVKELDIREGEELEKLRLNQRKEYKQLLGWMKTCNEAARGVTLMEQVQSGLCRRMKEVAAIKTLEKSNARLKLPNLIINEGTASTPENVIGKIEYSSGKILEKQIQNDSKNPEKPFKDILRKEFKIEKEVTLKGRCTRVSVIRGDIWAAISDGNCIQVIDLDGSVQREIACNFQPFSVKESPWGDIVVAGSGGLCIIKPDGTVESTISSDRFCDVSFFGEEVIGLNNTKTVIQCFCKAADGKWTCSGEIKASHGTGSYKEDCVITREQNIVFTVNGGNKSQFCKCMEKSGDKHTLASDQREMNYPFICGVDSDGTILVADCNNKMFQACDRDSKWQVFNIPCISAHSPFDLLYLADTDAVWVLLFSKGLVKLV